MRLPILHFQFSTSHSHGDGIPDAWEDEGAPLFTGVGGDGFPAGIASPEAMSGNYDVLLTITTSRHALLSWGGNAGEKALLPPCDGQKVRLRLNATATRTVTLSAVPGGAAGAGGAWRGGLSAEWDSRRELPTDGNRIEPFFGTFVDKEGEEGVRSEFLGQPGAGLRSGNGGGGIRSLSFLSKPWSMYLLGDSGCAAHDPFVSVELIEDNVPPPYVWTYGGGETNETTDTIMVFLADTSVFGNQIEVAVRQRDGIHSNLCPWAATSISLGRCAGCTTNLMPMTSREGFDAVTNHAPHVVVTPFVNGGNCPDGTNVTIYAGWEHGGDMLNRNFETIPTGGDDDLMSHCIATNWTENLEINLEDYLPEILMPHKDELRYRVNGDIIDGSTITAGKDEPEDLFPEIYHVEMCKEDDTVLDGLWIMVMSPQTSTEFETWVSNNATNADWLAQLPKPPSKILVDASGNASLPSEASANWNAPELFPTNSYMHPKAVYELRSIPISGGHGHQATYDANGNIITTSIKAGTADFASPSFSFIHGWHPVSHREDDVKPYIRALQLDGNPVFPINLSGEKSSFWTRNLSRPPLRVGSCTQQYLDRRPTTPTGILNIQ